MRMGSVHAGLLLQLLCSASSYRFRSRAGYGPFVQNPESEWERMKTMGGEERAGPAPRVWKSGAITADENTFPEWVYAQKSAYPKEVFQPEKGARPLPDWSGEILRVPVATSSTTAAAARAGVVELLCHVDRIYVRIRRDVFKSLNAYKDLKLGTCPVNQGTKAHYYLLYLLKTDCGFKLEVGKGVFSFVLIFQMLI